MAIKTVGIIGAGQMGSGIAHVCALAGYNVLLHDAAPDRLEKGIATINGNMARQVASGKLQEEQRADAMKLIRPANSMEDLAGVDLAIEAATEDETIKRKIFAQLCPVLNPE
ncbi:3-hydroxyacyl-CoA dehydrogenase NAD-binding domain-containing protein, partial [Brucella abortus]|nr:3-hydroxyacyl-CoA dehydrogenase NAD-binding domain-containing protein [Brucella abortus]